RLLAPIQNMMALYTNLVSGGVSLARVLELFDAPVEVLERPGAEAFPDLQGEIEFDNVSFRHGADTVLDNLSFKVPAGTICAILGPSGVGKSTLADLLVRFYDPDGGMIRIDGHDLRDLPIRTVRQAIVLLDQSPYLLQATVRENIGYARPDATDEEIAAASKAAAIHDRILALPHAYATLIP